MGRGHQLVGVWPECPTSVKIKTAKISSEESGPFSAKICTSENFPLYGILNSDAVEIKVSVHPRQGGRLSEVSLRGIPLASFPGPAQLSVTCSTVKRERAWYLFSRE